LEGAVYSVGIAYLLWFFSGCGILGFHRFYLGKIPTGLLWMFTVGLGGIGAVYDFFTLSRQVREANLRNAVFNGTVHGGGEYGRRAWRHVNDGEARVVGEKGSVERTILKLAKKNKGILTTSEVALEANVSIDDAKKNLDTLLNKGIAELRVRKSGTLVYVIPEMADRDEELEDF
jgi:TM2 domain-containing membrane protein YozV